MKQDDLRKIIKEEIQSILAEALYEKMWSEMSKEEKIKAYKVAIKSGDVKDTFKGFSKMMDGSSTFNTKTGKPIEISWR